MSDDQQGASEQKAGRTRKIVRSASTAERPGFDAPAAEGGAPASQDGPRPEAQGTGRKWDLRAERPQGAPSKPRPHGPPRNRGPRPAPGAPDAASGAPPAEGEGDRPSNRGGGRRFDRFDDSQPRRPGVSGGRAMPVYNRGPVDRASPEFVDKWLSMPPRKPEERRERPEGGRPESGPPGSSRGPKSGHDHGPGPSERRGKHNGHPPAAKLAAKPKEAPPPPAPKMPTLHETILVGLPKVAVEEQRDKSAHKPKTAREALAAKTAHAPPKAKQDEAEKGDEIVLDPAWLSASADGAVEALKSAGAAVDALVDAWLVAKNIDAIGAAAASSDLSGPARRAAKRAASVLKSRGVAVPDKPVAAAVATRPSEEEVVEATFNPPDSRGSSSVTIAKRRGGERAHIVEIVMREGVGVVNAVSGWMSRSQIKEAHQRIAESTGIAPAHVPADWVRFRVQRALEDNAKSGQLVPLGLERCKELLEPAVVEAPPHPSADLEAGLEAEGATAPASLHNEPEFRGWFPDLREVEDVVRRLGEKLNAEDAKDQAKVDEILKEEMKLATDRYFTPEQRANLARRMRDSVLTIRARSGEERAKDVLRAVKAIENAGLITSPPSDIEFLRTFFQKGIAMLAQRTGGQLRVPVANS